MNSLVGKTLGTMRTGSQVLAVDIDISVISQQRRVPYTHAKKNRDHIEEAIQSELRAVLSVWLNRFDQICFRLRLLKLHSQIDRRSE